MSSAAPGHALRRSLRKASSADTAEGSYHLTENTRELVVGRDGTTAHADMVSRHEALHAMLNASTTFGSCMTLVAALDEAGYPEFGPLLDKMLDACEVTHETFATVMAITDVNGGQVRVDLLDDAPDYHALLDRFDAAYDIVSRPFVGHSCLDLCARTAMQTGLAADWSNLPCPDWLDLRLGPPDRPDHRFEQMLHPDFAAEAMAAFDQALATVGPPLADLVRGPAPDEAAALVRAAPVEAQFDLQRLGYEGFAKVAARHGINAAGFMDARRFAPAMTRALETFAGDRLNRTFVTPATRDEDLDAHFFDYRRERMSIRPAPDEAIVIGIDDLNDELMGLLTQAGREERSLQLVALPREKARSLYKVRVGGERLVGDGTLHALRCRIQPAPDYPDGLIIMMELRHPAELRAIHEYIGEPPVRGIVSATAIESDDWWRTWMYPLRHQISTLLVIIDRDPFAYLQELAVDHPLHLDNVECTWGPASAPRTTNVVVATHAEAPRQVYCTPASGPLSAALQRFAGRLPGAAISEPMAPEHQAILTASLRHVLNEEHRFGFGFWRDGT